MPECKKCWTCVRSTWGSRNVCGGPVAHDAGVRVHAHAVVLPVAHVQGQDALRALLALLTLLHHVLFPQCRHHVPLTVLSPCHHDPPIPDLQVQGRQLLLSTTCTLQLTCQALPMDQCIMALLHSAPSVLSASRVIISRGTATQKQRSQVLQKFQRSLLTAALAAGSPGRIAQTGSQLSARRSGG